MLGRSVLIESSHTPLFELLRRLFEPFVAARTSDSPSRIVAVRDEERDEWRVDVDGERFGGSPTPWGAMIDVRNAAVDAALRDRDDLVSLHAAAVVKEGNALLLSGEPWAGKTTFSLQLANEGWLHFSDDVAPIDLASGRLRPFPKPPAIRSAPWAEFRHLWDPQPEWLPEPIDWFVVPALKLPLGTEDAVPRFFVHLRYREGAEGRVTEITSATAVIRSAPQARSLKPKQLARLASISRGMFAAELEYSDEKEGMSLLRSILQRWTEGGNLSQWS